MASLKKKQCLHRQGSQDGQHSVSRGHATRSHSSVDSRYLAASPLNIPFWVSPTSPTSVCHEHRRRIDVERTDGCGVA